MEIKYAHEMASVAEATRVAKCAKDTVSARTYLEENLMKDIEAVAEKGGNYMSHFINIKDEDVKKALKNLLRNYGYKASCSNGILEIWW